MAGFLVIFSAEQAAASLWDYGEDALVEPALSMGLDDLRETWRLAAQYYRVDFPLPDPGQRITLNHVTAYATLAHLEGQLRPLARGRRRPARDRPDALRSPKPFAGSLYDIYPREGAGS